MSWTKREICEEAYSELALAGYVFDSTPEEMQRAGRRLDMMMALWAEQGISLGYALSSSPGTLNLDADSGVPLYAVEPVVTNLAVRLGAGEGKMAHPSTSAKAKEGYEALTVRAAMPQRQQLRGGMPLGAGLKSGMTGRVFTDSPNTSPIQTGDNGNLDFLG